MFLKAGREQRMTEPLSSAALFDIMKDIACKKDCKSALWGIVYYSLIRGIVYDKNDTNKKSRIKEDLT